MAILLTGDKNKLARFAKRNNNKAILEFLLLLDQSCLPNNETSILARAKKFHAIVLKQDRTKTKVISINGDTQAISPKLLVPFVLSAPNKAWYKYIPK